MKNLYTHLFFLGLVIFFSSCNKQLDDPLDYLPKIELVSAIEQPDGTVLVTGKVISEGEAPLEYVGFCMDTTDQPNMLYNQKFADENFSAVYSGFKANTTYYFRAWATNDFGYVYSNTISLEGL